MQPRYGIFLFLFWFCQWLPAQTSHELDSLKALAGNEKTDTARVMLYNRIANVSLDTAEQSLYCGRALKLSDSIGFEKGKLTALTVIAINKRDNGDYVGAAYAYTAALRLALKEHNSYFAAKCYHQLGLIDEDFGNTEHAIWNIKQAVPLNISNKNVRWLRNNYEMLSMIYDESKQGDSALYYAKLARQIAFENHLSQSLLLHNLAEHYLQVGLLDSAFNYAELSDSAYRAVGNSYGIYWNDLTRASILVKKDKAAEAIPTLENIHRMAKSGMDNALLKVVIPVLIEAYTETKNTEKGFYIQQEWMKFQDSLLNNKYVNKSLGVQIALQQDLKEEVETLNKEKKEKEAQELLDHQKTIRNVVIAVALALLLIVFLVYRSFLQKKEANRIISEQKMMVEEKQKEIIDSIRYAKRIQSSQLPAEKTIARNLERLK